MGRQVLQWRPLIGRFVGLGMTYYEKTQEAAAFLKAKQVKAEVGLVLGTGLGTLADSLTNAQVIPFDECPHFSRTTAISHAGNLHFGELSNTPTMIMEGRFHGYEGYSMREIAFPIYVMQALGVKTLILTGACGGLNPQYALGDLVLAEDYINLMGDSPLAGPNEEKLGPRFPDMLEPFSKELINSAIQIGMQSGVTIHQGVYAAVKGPQLETRAEYRYLRQIGADIVGMSTIPETIAAKHAGMQVLSLSCVTDLCFPDALEPVDVPKIIRIAGEAEPIMSTIIKGVLK
ncbi:MAG: purine-nucleoside phosphorylase [Candidatus Omnitrophota bacterium]|jgi:purine-nucleoside phosphorylase